MSFVDDLIVRLQNDGFGQYGVNIFKGSRPVVAQGDGPFTSIIPTGGLGEEGTHNDSRFGIAYEQPSAQIVVRAEDADVAEAGAIALYAELNFVDEFVNGTWWRKCSPKQEPFDIGVDVKGRARWVFNIETVKRPSVGAAAGGTVFIMQQLVADFGGMYTGFVTPLSNDAYPSGATFDKLVPGSSPAQLNATFGSYILEASARVSAPGARAKVALVNLATPDTVIAEILFTTSEVIGERMQTSSFTLPGAFQVYGVKVTTNLTTVDGAAWGCRILKV